MDNQFSYPDVRSGLSNLSQRILEQIPKEAWERASRFLNFWRDGTLTFHSDAESYLLMDYLIYEFVRGGRSAVQIFGDTADELAPLDQELLNAMFTWKSSLYRIEQSWADRKQIRLHDCLAHNGNDITLTDHHLSQSIPNGTLVFMRIIQVQDMAISTGASMPFPTGLDGFLKRKASELHRSLRDIPAACRQFPVWARLFREWGLAIDYQDVQ